MAIQLNVQDFLSLLTCPVGLDPIYTAVSLSPCCHKANQVFAERYYGQITNGLCGLTDKKCVICNTPVTTYASDHTIRQLAALAFGHAQDLTSLPTHRLVLKEKKTEINLPYPGLPAVFVHTNGDWSKVYDSGGQVYNDL
jgi:hypothetical protein